MGRLIYGVGLEVAIDDNVLANLDVAVSMLRGEQFCVQITGLGGSHDGNLLSVHCGPGIPLALEYLNTEDVDIDAGAVRDVVRDARTVGVFELNRFRPLA
jgi:hypothetical protein